MEGELRHIDWKGTTGGTKGMQNLMIKWFRHTSLLIPYWCMGWMLPFYMIANRKSFLASLRFFRKRLNMSPIKSLFYVYLNYFKFGQIIVDRFAAYAGQVFKFDVEGQEIFDKYEQGKSGFLQLSSHVGNYELAGYSLKAKHKVFHALVFGGETETVMKSREEIFRTHNVNMVILKNDMSHIFALSQALSEGNIVSMPADRVFGSPRYIQCNFFNDVARFPMGPFALAIQRDVPVIAVFVMKIARKRYKIYVREISGTTREELCQSYATELENIILKHPTQWFNFYNFWK